AQNRRTTVPVLRDIVRRWLISEQYRQVVTGTQYRDPGGGSLSLAVSRLENLMRSVQELQQFGGQLPPQLQQRLLDLAILQANGSRRLSAPMLRSFLNDNFSTVEGRVVLVRPDVEAAPEPDEATLTEVFETYKDRLPGAALNGDADADGPAFSFGYRYPDRVKLDYVRIPMLRVREAVEIEYVDILEAYQANPSRFADEGGNAPAAPTAEAAQTLRDELTDAEAERLAQRIVAKVQGLLAEGVRGFDTGDGYVALPDDYRPTPWLEIVEAVRAERGVQLDILGDPTEWLALEDLIDLEGIGFSALGDTGRISFPQYVAATRRLAEDPDLVPRSIRSEVGVASKPLRGIDGFYFFRLADAQANHPPASLDEVRERVVADAKTIAAFERLAEGAESWHQMAVAAGLDAVAEAASSGSAAQAAVNPTGPFQKVADATGNPPSVLGVGTSRPFVDAAFALAEALDGPAVDVSGLPRDRRVAVTPLPAADGGPALGVFVLDGFAPLTRSGYTRAVAGGAASTVNSALTAPDMSNPMSLEAVAARVGFDLEAYEN
ncbi:MAG: hypothetical protein AAFX76_12125, partial [Planctomycetota bacterium]